VRGSATSSYLPTLFPELTDDEIEQVARAVQHAVAELE